MLGTFFEVKPSDRIPEQIWQEFCTDMPWCSQPYSFGSSAQNTLLALLFTSLIDTCITWCQYDKLNKLASRFKQICQDTQGTPLFVIQYFQKINDQLSEILNKLQALETRSTSSSTSVRQNNLKDDINRKRKYIQELLQGSQNQQMLANISRGIALSVYLQKDFHSINPLQNLVKKAPLEKIIRDLLNSQGLQKKDDFILEDELLLPISYCLQIPIHYYLNHYDVGGQTLTRRRVHAQNEEQVLIFLIENGNKSAARVLCKYHPSIAIKNHLDMQNQLQASKVVQTHPSKAIQPPGLPLIKNKDILQCVNNVLDQILQQMAIENSRISELWLKKINEIIQQGDTQQLISKKQVATFKPQLIQSISDLNSVLDSDKETESNFSSRITNQFDYTLQFFENLLITQVTIVRDNLFEHIQSIKVPQRNSYSKAKKNDHNNKKENSLPSRPNILDKQIKQNKFKLDQANTFQQQKVISNQCQIQAKVQVEDLPDPCENLIQFEIDSEQNLPKLSISQIKQRQNFLIQLPKIDEKEYHTSDEGFDSCMQSPQKEVDNSSQEILIEEDQTFNYQKIIDDDQFNIPKIIQAGEQIYDDDFNTLINKPGESLSMIASFKQQKQTQSSQNIPQQSFDQVMDNHQESKKSHQKDDIHDHKNYSSESQPHIANRDSFQQMYIQRVNCGNQSQGNTKIKSSLGATCDYKSQQKVNLTGSLSYKNEDPDNKISFVPNNSRRSLNYKNCQDRMTRSQATSSRFDFGDKSTEQSHKQFRARNQEQLDKNYEQLDQSRITEVDEIVNSSVFLEFLCPICFDTISNYQDIKIIHDNHKICVACLESWIKVKFNAGQWNLKFFKCPIQQEKLKVNQQCDHLIDIELIKQVLNDEEFGKLCERSMQVGYIDIQCPWEDCEVSIRGMPPKNSDGITCPECQKEICWVCRDKSHEGRICPQRLEEIKGALLDERIGCCPECLEIYMKNEGCQHVQCYKCAIDFCFACSAPRVPIMSHGSHYHRVGCDSYSAYIDEDTKVENLSEEYEPKDCEFCKQTKKPCPRPLDLISFKKLAHLNF